MRRREKQGIGCSGALFDVEHHGKPAAAGRGADRRCELGIVVVRKHAIDVDDQPVGIGNACVVQCLVTVVRDGSAAVRIHQNGRHGRNPSVYPHAGAGDALGLKTRHDTIADRIVSIAFPERSRKAGGAAEPRDGDRRIGGPAADDGDEVERPDLGVALREGGDAKDLIENSNPAAENVRAAQRSLRFIRSHRHPPPRRE
jgi:hypothetical protein